jgi:hypothetical protein
LGGKPEGIRLLERFRHRREDNIKMKLQEVGCECMGWIELFLNRGRRRELLKAVMNIRIVHPYIQLICDESGQTQFFYN